MSDILNYKFYLNFKNTDSFGRLQITEPVGFDGASFVIEQESKRYGRDAYKINEEINLTFYKGNFEPSEMQQLPNGTVSYHLTQGYDWLKEVIDEFGFEADVDFEIELNGVLFIPSNLDFQTCETDGFTYLSCKAVQEQSKQLIKRRADIETNIFSDEDLDGTPVTPATTENILVKAKPITQISKLEAKEMSYNEPSFGFQNFVGTSLFRNLTAYDIDDTFTPFLDFYQAQLVNEPNFLETYRSDISVIKAQTDLSNIVINIKGLSLTAIADDPVYVTKELTVNHGTSYVSGEFETIVLESTQDNILNIVNQDYEVNIPFVPSGGFIYIHFYMLGLTPSGGVTPVGNFSLNVTSGNLEIKATSTAIDTVVKGVRYIDVIKANLKRINGYDVFAPRYDVGGEYYDQFAFTGNLIKQRDDVAFSVKFKDLMEDLQELNADYQITDKLYIGQYLDYYPNKEIGVFLTAPDDSFKFSFNERYAINEFSFKYQTYEQDDSEENTTDAIHTDTQWLLSNLQVENSKEINIKYIRDAFKLEKTRKDASKDTTSTSDDDKMFLLDVVRLAPSSRGGFSALMTHNVNDDGQVQLLKDANLPSWAVLGFGVGSQFFINTDDNNGEYEVAEIENTIITLNPINPSTQSFTGESYTEVEYPYTNVAWVNRTNEGLVFSENLLNAENYANLKYSIKRNLQTWKPYIDTALMYKPNGTFKNTYFKDNGDAITRFDWETTNIQEDATITKDELTNKVITARLYETRLVAPYNDMVNVINAIDTVNADNTIGGFIRCIDNNGKVIKLYPQKLDYVPSTNELTLTGEERYEGDGVNIVITNDIVTINEVGYDINELSSPFYEVEGDYLKIYDVNKLPVINPTKYMYVTVNGQTFDSSSDLFDYLVNF